MNGVDEQRISKREDIIMNNGEDGTDETEKGYQHEIWKMQMNGVDEQRISRERLPNDQQRGCNR